MAKTTNADLVSYDEDGTPHDAWIFDELLGDDDGDTIDIADLDDDRVDLDTAASLKAWESRRRGDARHEKPSERRSRGYQPPDTTNHPELFMEDAGDWGGSYEASRAITKSSADVMNLRGNHPPPLRTRPSRVRMEGKPAAHAKMFLSHIASDKDGSEETLYHGFQNVRKTTFAVGDTLKLPLTATSGDRDLALGYTGSKQPTLFQFEPGTAIAAYQKYPLSKDDEFYHVLGGTAHERRAVYAEALTAGGYTVARVGKTTSRGKTVQVVTLRQTQVFNPKTKRWVRRG